MTGIKPFRFKTHITLLLFHFTFILAYAQNTIVSGTVTDTLNNALENANIIAMPKSQSLSLQFSITDNKGHYKLQLDKSSDWEITVSYLSHLDKTFVLSKNDLFDILDFKLIPTGEQLKEIIISHEYKPVIVKKDTLIYDVSAFINNSDRKLKDVLGNMPGVEVNKDGTVTVQGKKVTQLLVEGKSFFGGGSKLAVENIPADVLDKIEVIDHFNTVGFLKKVSDSNELALNVKLKEDKKKFLFGDIEALGGTDNHYLLHSSLFYYSPKTNFSFIGDLNNTGKSTFTFSDMMRFTGGLSNYTSGRKPLANLYGFTDDNTDVTRNITKFAALNFSHQFSDKLELSGFTIVSKSYTSSYTESKITYLQDLSDLNETRIANINNKNTLALGNLKLDYTAGKTEKLYYNLQYEFSGNNNNNLLSSFVNESQNIFKTISKAKNKALKHYLEWHKSYTEKQTTTLAVSHSYEQSTPNTNWYTDNKYLTGILPLITDTDYTIIQNKRIISNSVDAIFKNYWALNNANHIYTAIGNNLNVTKFTTNEKQEISTGGINNFDDSGLFGNNLNYKLNDFYIATEYKFKIGKWLNRPGLYLHNYYLQANEAINRKAYKKTVLQPQWNSEYEFSKSESLRFNYRLSNSFAEPYQMASKYTLQGYNMVFRGNDSLTEERYHAATLNYNKMNMFKGIVVSGIIVFNKKVKTLRNQAIVEEVIQDGKAMINQFTTPVLTNNPETYWNTQGYIQKKIGIISLKLNAALSWLNYYQILNGETFNNSQNSQNIGLTLQTNNKKGPSVIIKYQKGFGKFNGQSRSEYQNDVLETSVGYEIMQCIVFKADYSYITNKNNQFGNTSFQIGNISVIYQKKKSPWLLEASVNNFLDNTFKVSNTFTDYTTITQKTYTLPRIILVGISYKL